MAKTIAVVKIGDTMDILLWPRRHRPVELSIGGRCLSVRLSRTSKVEYGRAYSYYRKLKIGYNLAGS